MIANIARVIDGGCSPHIHSYIAGVAFSGSDGLPCGVQDPYKKQLEPMLHQYVLPAFNSKFGHLRAKACWVSGQYADIDFRDGRGCGPTFSELFGSTVKALQDPELPVRAGSLSVDFVQQQLFYFLHHVASLQLFSSSLPRLSHPSLPLPITQIPLGPHCSDN